MAFLKGFQMLRKRWLGNAQPPGRYGYAAVQRRANGSG
jgi:hypothetical protein